MPGFVVLGFDVDSSEEVHTGHSWLCSLLQVSYLTSQGFFVFLCRLPSFHRQETLSQRLLKFYHIDFNVLCSNGRPRSLRHLASLHLGCQIQEGEHNSVCHHGLIHLVAHRYLIRFFWFVEDAEVSCQGSGSQFQIRCLSNIISFVRFMLGFTSIAVIASWPFGLKTGWGCKGGNGFVPTCERRMGKQP